MTSSGNSERQRYDIMWRVTRERELNVAKNWECVFCTTRTVQMIDFELILTVKMETSHARREIGVMVRYLPDKKFACLSNCRFCSDCAQNLPGPALNNVLRVLQISS